MGAKQKRQIARLKLMNRHKPLEYRFAVPCTTGPWLKYEWMIGLRELDRMPPEIREQAFKHHAWKCLVEINKMHPYKGEK